MWVVSVALPIPTPPQRMEKGVSYHAALPGYRLDLVVDFLNISTGGRLRWFSTILRYNELDVSVSSCF